MCMNLNLPVTILFFSPPLISYVGEHHSYKTKVTVLSIYNKSTVWKVINMKILRACPWSRRCLLINLLILFEIKRIFSINFLSFLLNPGSAGSEVRWLWWQEMCQGFCICPMLGLWQVSKKTHIFVVILINFSNQTFFFFVCISIL